MRQSITAEHLSSNLAGIITYPVPASSTHQYVCHDQQHGHRGKRRVKLPTSRHCCALHMRGTPDNAALLSDNSQTMMGNLSVTTASNLWPNARALAGWPRRTTRMPRAMRPSTRLSVAALVSPHARMGPVRSARLGAAPPAVASTCSSASSVRVLPVPGGPCAAALSHSLGLMQISACHPLTISGLHACDTKRRPCGR